MIFIGILLSMATIAFLCWLLFTLAVFALPLFAGITAGTWAYDTGAGWLGVVVGFAAAALTFGLGSFCSPPSARSGSACSSPPHSSSRLRRQASTPPMAS